MTASTSAATSEPRALAKTTRVKVWDLPLRIFHWLLVIAIALAFLSSEEDSPLNQWHILAGWIVGILIVFRVVWGFVGGEHSRFLDFIRPSRVGEHVAGLLHGRAQSTLGHNPLGGISVVVLLALAATSVWTGAFGGEATEDLHGFIGWTLLAFVGLHVSAVVIMSVLQRENLVAAMITGYKRAPRENVAADAKSPSTAGILLALLVLAGAVYGILRYDPKALTLRPAESLEQSRGTGGDAAKPEQREQD